MSRYARNILMAAVICGLCQSSPLLRANGIAAETMPAQARPVAHLLVPLQAAGPFPTLLSQTGVFKDLKTLTPVDGLIPYDLIQPFWSDGAEKARWISVPAGGKIHFTRTGEWKFPKGTILVKHFELPTDETNPSVRRRLETRLLVFDDSGDVYGLVYKWRADNRDADLLATNLTETITVKTATGTRTQDWYYPSRKDCVTCHTANAGFSLGVKTRQLNREWTYPSGVTDNELHHWSQMGLFDVTLTKSEAESCPKLAAEGDTTRSLADRARSYLDANCAQCHRPKGTVAYFDARYDTPLAKQGLIDGSVLIDQRIDGARVIAPNDIWRSILYMRANTVEAFKMPPLARNTIDHQGMTLLRQWIESLPGQPTLPPPDISPRGGNFTGPVTVVLKSEPGATIRYTVDGTVPTSSDFLYDKPIQLTGPTILRAKAFKAGFTRSITAKEIYLIGG